MKDKKPIKQYFEVRMEVMLPATLTYRVYAETPEEAIELIKHKAPNTVKPRINGKKDLKIMVYNAGTSLIRLIKNLTR